MPKEGRMLGTLVDRIVVGSNRAGLMKRQETSKYAEKFQKSQNASRNHVRKYQNE
jgi:hypothetical protein